MLGIPGLLCYGISLTLTITLTSTLPYFHFPVVRTESLVYMSQFTYYTMQKRLTLHRGSYMSAHVLLNLLYEFGKRDKMRDLSSILSLLQRVK